jgi:hypothetical protein
MLDKRKGLITCDQPFLITVCWEAVINGTSHTQRQRGHPCLTLLRLLCFVPCCNCLLGSQLPVPTTAPSQLLMRRLLTYSLTRPTSTTGCAPVWVPTLLARPLSVTRSTTRRWSRFSKAHATPKYLFKDWDIIHVDGGQTEEMRKIF